LGYEPKVKIHHDCPVISFEDPTQEARHFAAHGYSFNRSVIDPTALLLCKQFSDELFTCMSKGSLLVIQGYYFAIDEEMAPVDFESLKVPQAMFSNASQIDIRLGLIPRYTLSKCYTIEAQVRWLH
jgi:hypothetical protein